ncbi:MAG: hypothetical protein IBJ03_00900 [Gemmatimonadaceae bacterium]|nr:hypothetical protein [Gemmatimonadaceae bacterium]
MVACGESSAPSLTPEPRFTRAVRSADGHNTESSWASVVHNHRITSIREVQGRLGHVRVRVYQYDSTGRLRDFSERAFTAPRNQPVVARELTDSLPLPIDSVEFVNRQRDYLRTAVLFRADMAVLAAGRSGNAPVTYSRRELLKILDRAGRLYDAAIRGGSVVPRVPIPSPSR